MATELSLSTPSWMRAGESAIGTVTYFGPQLSGEIPINLSATKGGEVIPSRVTINLNQSNSATFLINAQNVSQEVTIIIKAESPTARAERRIVVHPAGAVSASFADRVGPAIADLVSFVIDPPLVDSGQPSVGKVMLNRPVGMNGITISLDLVDSSQSSFVSFPPRVRIVNGDSTMFSIHTNLFGGPDRIAVIRAKGIINVKDAELYMRAFPLPRGERFAAGSIPINESIVLGITPHSVPGGTPATGTVEYRGPQQARVAVKLRSSNPHVAIVPDEVEIPLVLGINSADFVIQTFPVGPDTLVTISGELVGNPNATADDTILVTNNRP